GHATGRPAPPPWATQPTVHLWFERADAVVHAAVGQKPTPQGVCVRHHAPPATGCSTDETSDTCGHGTRTDTGRRATQKIGHDARARSPSRPPVGSFCPRLPPRPARDLER